MRTLPFLNGYSVAPGLVQIHKLAREEQSLFEIDVSYQDYLNNKASCRKEDITKYYCDTSNVKVIANVNRFIVQHLQKDHSDKFLIELTGDLNRFENRLTGESFSWRNNWVQVDHPMYVSLFDALVSQVQEDVAICQVENNQDEIVSLHICSPNHWAPAPKLGKSFSQIHDVVPGMNKNFSHYPKMLKAIIHKGPFARFAWGLSTDCRLNHHPEPPLEMDVVNWQGRKIEEGCDLFVRVEKQLLYGLPFVNAFLFTIRTCFYAVSGLDFSQKLALLHSIKEMTKESQTYKGINGKVKLLEKMLLTT